MLGMKRGMKRNGERMCVMIDIGLGILLVGTGVLFACAGIIMLDDWFT